MPQRKSRVGSFYIDIEKNGLPYDDKQHKHFKSKINNGKSNFLTVTFFSLCIMCSVYFIYNYRSLWNNNLQLDQSILLSSTSNANSPEISILKDELMSNYDDVNNGGTGLSLSNEVQEELKHQHHTPHTRVSAPLSQKQPQEGSVVDSGSQEEKDDNEENDNDYDISNSKSNIDAIIEENDDLEQDPDMHILVQENLKEIFSVNPIIVLSLNNQIDKLNTILLNLNISPEPKIINLSRHPNYLNILKYLKNINHSDVENIPRLFLGGLPVGTSKEIIEMYENNELISYLRSKGEGLINV
ncbi:predicted protein [Candida tropicalis MYA-3404]|uniref:Uncharacterized protein n=1 Tax=Candida tropicalis (strain ATCC MYA-3404 / T1) TaxID=294747 RepID=C5M7J2_CANTT|nr:predicted protein [Candida tropicalis MYA-3404]EER34962.1 predicted protein [Candida tropicalis MYA-3404]KAG4408846.1 hypothetical protein JTP64_002152 [Candida tropicalis]